MGHFTQNGPRHGDGPKQLESKATKVCWGLIKGLAYLHELCIAHRDIKPDNLVVDQDFCLKIIDFDIAMQLKDENEKVDDGMWDKALDGARG